MYEPALRIDMGEMVNSRFHQTQQESGSLNCQMAFSFWVFFWSCRIWPFGSKSPRVKNVGVFCLLKACLFSRLRHFKLLNVMFEVKPKIEGLDALFSFWLEGFYTIHSFACLILLAHWLDSSINWR